MTTTTPPDAQAAQNALIAMISRDREGVVAAVETLIEHGGPSVYAAMCGWACVAAEVMIGDEAGEGWYIEAIDDATGKQVSIDDTTLPQGYRTAFRMITAFKNEDHAMMTALFKPSWESENPEDLFDLITSMLDLAATAARHHMEHQHGDEQA